MTGKTLRELGEETMRGEVYQRARDIKKEQGELTS